MDVYYTHVNIYICIYYEVINYAQSPHEEGGGIFLVSMRRGGLNTQTPTLATPLVSVSYMYGQIIS